MRIAFEVDNEPVEVEDDGSSLLEVLRAQLGCRAPKDGCSPQGQCGCCTVLVDGVPRVACVTPARRIAGRKITTLDGLPPDDRQRWAEAFVATGASQCGFCTPGIITRLSCLDADASVERALSAHLCRCTGWRTIIDAWDLMHSPTTVIVDEMRDLDAASQRATIEGGTPQRVSTDIALGRGGFSEDSCPEGALVAVPNDEGGWTFGETLTQARALAGKVQGRRSTLDIRHPIEVPEGNWALTLRTTWVEPAYLETDASWCAPGGEPSTPLANGGAFGGKTTSVAPEVARRLANEHQQTIRVVLSREDTVRLGPKRPPMAAGVRFDGTGIVRVARTQGIVEAIQSVAPGLNVEEVDVPGPPTSIDLRGGGWVEASVLLAGLTNKQPVTVRSPAGATATAMIDPDGQVQVKVACGNPLDEVVLRSYCIGAAHMALGWVRSEGIAVDEEGKVHDLTIRSFGVLRALDTPAIEIEIVHEDTPAIPGSEAVFAAVAAAAWIACGRSPSWPTSRT
ncbi:MAG: 2Fe-2S iron-sulfur cluster-binding protein [Acidimicrobiales bacterium]